MTTEKLAIVPLNKPDPILIERLEEVLEMAKRGEIINFAMVTINSQREWAECCPHPDKNLLELIGALEALKTRLIIQNVEMP